MGDTYGLRISTAIVIDLEHLHKIQHIAKILMIDNLSVY